jgi:ParB-like nuclease domain
MDIERVPLDKLSVYPGNPRRGNVPLLTESLAEYSQTKPVVVQRSTGYILAGNHTYQAARQLGWTHIDVAWADWDDAKARKYLLMDNRTTDIGTYDEELLAEILAELQEDFAFTGYEPDDIDDILAREDMMPVLPVLPTSASYRETDEEYQDRLERNSDAVPLIARGIRDFMVKCTQAEYEEIHSLLRQLRAAYDPDLVQSQLLLTVLRTAADHLSA